MIKTLNQHIADLQKLAAENGGEHPIVMEYSDDPPLVVFDRPAQCYVIDPADKDDPNNYASDVPTDERYK